MRPSTGCIDEDTALALLERGVARASTNRHLAQCDACRAFVAGLARIIVPDASASLGGWGRGEGELAPGTVVGNYRIGAVLGRGGMGVVYEGEDPRLGRVVAIKLLHDAIGERRVAWMRREAGVMAKLSHPNVAAVFDYVESPHGPAIVMERVWGVTLACWTAQRTPAEIVGAYVQAGRGLCAAHRAGVVHRDFKPSNAMVVTDGDVGRVKVLDFGLASAQVLGAGAHRHGGTPRYAAPELFAGDAATPACDQFSFCVALFEALAGRYPYAGASQTQLRTSMLSGTVRALPPRVVPTVARALIRGLSVRPRDRFPSMNALLDALTRRERDPKAWVVAGTVAIVGLVAAGGETPAPCDDGRARMERTWSADRTPEWTSRLEVRRHGVALDRHVAAWLEARREACSQRAASPARFEHRAACLERSAGRIAGAARRLRSFADTDVLLPSNVLGDLQPPSACLDDETDLRVDDLLRDELEQLTAFAAGLEREEGLDRSDVARIGSRAEELLTRSLKLGDTRAQAKVHVVLGKLRLFAEEYDASLRHLEAAYFVAELAGDVHTQHATCVTLVMLSARYLGDVKRAEYWASRLEMAAEQVGTDVARGEAALYRATVHRVAGRVDDAVESLGRAVASLQPDSFSRAEALRTRGELGLMRGDLEGARADLIAAVTLLEGLSGAQHPDLAGPLNALATLEFTDGDFDAGLVLLERALSVTADRQNLQRALMQGNLALAYRERGRLAEALVVIEDVLSQLVASLGPHHPDTIRTEVERAELLLELDQEQEAVVVLERVFDSEAAPSDVRAQAATSLAPLSDEPRTILARAAGLPGLSPSWASYVAELLDAYDDGA